MLYLPLSLFSNLIGAKGIWGWTTRSSMFKPTTAWWSCCGSGRGIFSWSSMGSSSNSKSCDMGCAMSRGAGTSSKMVNPPAAFLPLRPGTSFSWPVLCLAWPAWTTACWRSSGATFLRSRLGIYPLHHKEVKKDTAMNLLDLFLKRSVD